MSEDEPGAGDDAPGSGGENGPDGGPGGWQFGTGDEPASADAVEDPTRDPDPPEGADVGAPSGPTEPSRTDDDLAVEDYVTGERSLDPRVRVQWLAWVAVVSAVFGLAVWWVGGWLFGVDRTAGVGAGSGAFVLGVAWVVLHYRWWRYEVRADSLYLERGVVTHVRTVVPFVRIQHVDTQRNPVERALGLSRIVVYTAGSRGADVSVPGLTPDEARDLQARIKRLAIEAGGEDAV